MSDAVGAYLAGLWLVGRRVLVVGGGAVAERRVPALLEAGADVLLVAPWASERIERLAAAGRLVWQAREYVPADLDGAWYVIAATDVPDVNAAVAAAAEAARAFCVRADEASGGTALTPATGHAGAITLAVLAGRDPRRAAVTRDALLAALASDGLDLGPLRGRPH